MGKGEPLGQMVIELGLDDSSFGKSLQGAKNATKVWSSEMKANMKIADLAGNKMGVLDAKQQGLTKTIQAQQQVVEQLSKSYKGSFVDGQPTEQTAKLAAQLQNANGQLANYQTQLINTVGDIAQLKIETEGFTGRMNTFGQTLTSTGDKMSNIGGKMTVGLTAPIVAGVGLAVKAAIDFESAFAGTKKTVDELVDSNGKVIISYDDLSQGIRNMSKELPASASEIAAVAEAAGQLGIKTENVLSFSKVMIDLGESTNMGAETAATALARLANITQMPQDQFTNLGSSLVELGNNFATTESEITEMSLRLAGAGKQIGMSEADILGFATALSSVGIEAEAGGSAFSKVMINMQLAVENGMGSFDELAEKGTAVGASLGQIEHAVGKGGKELKNLAGAMGMTAPELRKMYKEADEAALSLIQFSDVAGVTNAEFATLFRSNPAEAIQKFVVGLSEAEKQGTSAIKVLDDMDIKEVRLRDSLLRAANASGVFGDAIAMSNKAWNENTALTDEANKRYETTESKLKMLKNQVNDVAIEFGGPFVDALREGVTAATPLIKSAGDLAKAFSNANPETKKLITNLILGTAAAGPFLKITGSLTKGIGGLTTNTVGMLGVMAKKKTIADFSQQLLTGSTDIIKWEGASKTAKTATDLLGGAAGSNTMKLIGFKTAASSAAGANGVGAMTSSLITLNPWVVGIGATLAVGYGAWKIWGEEAWNSGQRTKQWGTDVGEVTDKALTDIQSTTQKASGQFSLMSDGFQKNSDEMASNFVKIGETIENSLVKKIEGLDALIKELPTSVDSSLKELVENEKTKAQQSLEIVQANSARIGEIRANASSQNRELNVSEAKIIKDLAKDTTQAYVATLDLSASEKKRVLSAMTGDVANASQEEAQLWLQSLGQQRQAAAQHMDASRKEKEKYLVDLGYNLDGEFAQKFLLAWDEINKTTVDGFDTQITTIMSKYPELIGKVWAANGQLINANDDAAAGMIAGNKEIMKSAENLSKELADNAQKNAKALAWTADEFGASGKKAAQAWNKLELIDHEGNLKTNAAEIITEATKDTRVWNDMRFVIHDANLDSNAKLMIGEAAIANGWWDGMAWSDKQAVLNSNASETVFKALKDSGKWNELSFEEKKALLYSNTPEKMAETMLNLGMWDAYQPVIKELGANNIGLLEKIRGSNELLAAYNGLPISVKELVAENSGLIPTVDQARKSVETFSNLPDVIKNLIADDSQMTPTVDQAKIQLESFSTLPLETKELLGNNEDVMSKVNLAKTTLESYVNLNTMDPKILQGNNTDVVNKVNSAKNSLDIYDKNNPKDKVLQAQNAALIGNTNAASRTLDNFNAILTPTKYLQANAEYSQVLAAKNVIDNINDKNVKIQVTYEGKQTGNFAIPNEKGTNYHPGGDMIVNDQKGPLYKELVEFPGKTPFIPQGRDVYIPDAPRGTKVWTASQTKRKIPHYANGVGIPENSKLMQSINRVSDVIGGETSIVINNTDGPKLDTMINILQKLLIEFTNFDAKTEINFNGLSREVEKNIVRRSN